MAFRRRREPSPAPKLDALTAAETEWRDNQLEVARLLGERYVGETPGVPDLAALDQIVAGWLDDDDSRVDVNTLVNGVGIAMGHHIAAATGLSWVIATDEYGSDLALHGRPQRSGHAGRPQRSGHAGRQPGDLLIYPANAAAKRITAEERGFVTPLAGQLVEGVNNRRATE